MECTRREPAAAGSKLKTKIYIISIYGFFANGRGREYENCNSRKETVPDWLREDVEPTKKEIEKQESTDEERER
ncbi:hypothetical protein IEQ_04969 [Bacillus cereus BAG6X1-2]|nr:hypothetical protein IEQ_04969 [Bacillus cereus BAG6X1-2]